MKNIIKKIGKSVAIQIVAFSIIVGGIALAVSFPTSTPTGQTAGGKFQSYFNNLFTPCPTGQVIIGIKNDGTIDCSSVGPNFLSSGSVTQTKVSGGYVDLTTTQNISGIKTFKGNGGQTSMNIPSSSGGYLPSESSWYSNWAGGLRTRDILAASMKLIGSQIISNNGPTIYLQDTDHRTAMLHTNSNIFYILSGNTGSTTWNKFPMYIDLNTNNMTVNGNITATSPTATNHVATKAYVDNKLNCRDVTNWGPAPAYFSNALCGDDEYVLNGGGCCGFLDTCGGNGADKGLMHFSGPHGNGWAVDCFQSDGSGESISYAFATCCKK